MIQAIWSGGQTGADRGALEAAQLLGLKTGGWIPKGFRAEDGLHPEFSRLYNLKEHESSDYSPRTKANVHDTDGTILIAKSLQSPGSRLTIHYCERLGKPIRIVRMGDPFLAITFFSWIAKFKIRILNVAGNRESKAPGIQQYTKELFLEMFEEAKTRELLVNRDA